MKTIAAMELLIQELLQNAPGGYSQECLANALELMTNERERAVQTIRETIYHFNGDQGRKSAYIEYLQTEICKVSDRYVGRLPNPMDNNPAHSLISRLLQALNDVYLYLKENYASAFNDQLKVPLALKQAFATENQKMAATIIRALTASGEDKALMKLIGDYLNVLSKPAYRPVQNSRELNYLTTFVTALYQLVNNYTGPELRTRLFLDLIRLNFNYFPLICYYTKAMQTDYDQVEFYQDELVKVAGKIRDLRSVPVYKGNGYENGTSSLSAILAQALEEEEIMLKKHLRIQSRITYKKWENRLFSPYFLRVSATVEQVVYFFRVLIEIGFFTGMKKVTYFDYIAKHIETDHQQIFSTGYVKNRYNNPKKLTSDKVKSYFLKAVQWINEHPPMD
ncbi:hypothetical protein [Mucilaginibacter sp. KACC 22063]|uniref:hypothetical protein n=1 Tax=Mucilaginibacter sp. KACC 22063 TaxID=3025666 RepID=UPI00236538C6|nr:hypothetical protein [Mucilaginibacter sp. KACC 22063]WDF55820.1 hypothetical protein PQ461_01935 [Mucilaginibacter sp. KACC 22063]